MVARAYLDEAAIIKLANEGNSHGRRVRWNWWDYQHSLWSRANNRASRTHGQVLVTQLLQKSYWMGHTFYSQLLGKGSRVAEMSRTLKCQGIIQSCQILVFSRARNWLRLRIENPEVQESKNPHFSKIRSLNPMIDEHGIYRNLNFHTTASILSSSTRSILSVNCWFDLNTNVCYMVDHC